MAHYVTRYHDFSCAHRAHNDPGPCNNIHGHNYRVHITLTSEHLDELGRVWDFAKLKTGIFFWIDENWDHRLLLSNDDPLLDEALNLQRHPELYPAIARVFGASINVINGPTSTEYLAEIIGQLCSVMTPPHIKVAEVRLEETRKCGASWQPDL